VFILSYLGVGTFFLKSVVFSIFELVRQSVFVVNRKLHECFYEISVVFNPTIPRYPRLPIETVIEPFTEFFFRKSRRSPKTPTSYRVRSCASTMSAETYVSSGEVIITTTMLTPL